MYTFIHIGEFQKLTYGGGGGTGHIGPAPIISQGTPLLKLHSSSWILITLVLSDVANLCNTT